MSTQPSARLLAAAVASIDVLHRLAGVVDQELAITLLNLADLLDGARSAAGAELPQGDTLLAEHIRDQISELPCRAVPLSSTEAVGDGCFLAEAALIALKHSARDVAWLATAAFDEAKRHVLVDGWSGAMAPANRAVAVREAIAQRIAMLEPQIGAVVATRTEIPHARH